MTTHFGRRVATLVAGSLVVLTGAGSITIRAQAPAAAPRNLQVLPQETPQEEVLRLMRSFTEALGVQCAHCHIQAAPAGRGRGRGAPTFDYVSDDLPQKKTARAMMLMVRELGATITAVTGKAPDTVARVQCVTCHRGVAIPKQLTDILDQVTREQGTTEATTVYRDLRRRYFGAQAYDFSENVLIAYAERAVGAGRAEDAMAWLDLNLEYFPRSARTHVGLSEAQRKSNPQEALRSLERAAELDPENAQIRRQLDQLRGKGGQ